MNEQLKDVGLAAMFVSGAVGFFILGAGPWPLWVGGALAVSALARATFSLLRGTR